MKRLLSCCATFPSSCCPGTSMCPCAPSSPTRALVEPGDVFVCLPGYRTEGGETRADRHDFIPTALARGATALVVERARRCRRRASPSCASPTPGRRSPRWPARSSTIRRGADRGRRHRHERQDVDDLLHRVGARGRRPAHGALRHHRVSLRRRRAARRADDARRRRSCSACCAARSTPASTRW